MKILVAHANNYDYQTELYQPLKQSAIIKEHTVIFPHDQDGVEIDTNAHIPNSNLLIAEISHRSTGAGIEIGLAQAANVPTLFLCKTGATPTSALKFVKGELIEYTGVSDLIVKVEEYIAKM